MGQTNADCFPAEWIYRNGKRFRVATMSLSTFVTLTSCGIVLRLFFLGGFVRWKAAVSAEREQYRVTVPSTVKVNPS